MAMASDSYFPGDLKTQGDAKFVPGTRYLRLIKTDDNGNPQPNSIGRAVINHSVHMRNGPSQVDIQSTLKFRVGAAANSIPGAGLAFFIAPFNYPIPVGSDGDKYGIFNPTGNSPLVFAVVFNTKDQIVGINIESPVPRAKSSVDGLVGNDVTAEIKYVAATKEISVEVTVGGIKQAPVKCVYDLGEVLNEYVTVGISGTTGNEVANHDVLVWHVTPN